jgi:hypothetical protein
LVEEVHTPLAVRSSSLLEDGLLRPFAGVYETKMIPNNQPGTDARFHSLVEAIKLVYASTFFSDAKSYVRATDHTTADEKMAVIVQEVVGYRFGDHFYPHISGVARSFNFYPVGRARPEEGVVCLALGLGKTIVDGGLSWTFSPAHPKAPPPYGSLDELLDNSQRTFWSVNMGRPAEYNPIAETEYLVEADLATADYDGTLEHIASTLDSQADRLVPGTNLDGPRVLNFSPLLVLGELPLNDLVKALLTLSEAALDKPVELEFAVVLPSRRSDAARLGFLQVRPMLVSDEVVEIAEEELAQPDLLVASERSMGNGRIDSVRDVVYAVPERFEAAQTRAITGELEQLNASLLEQERPYLVIGFGRWGSSDPWLGIPVQWGQICGARVIVEATLPDMNVELSQGSHFFHNLSSFGVSYLMVHHTSPRPIYWQWLASQPSETETRFLRHLRLSHPLRVKVDGRSCRGAVWHQQ